MAKKADYTNVLVIRLSAMGDVAMTVPVLLALARTYPKLSITVLTKANYAPIFTTLPGVVVIPVAVKNEHKGILGLFRLYKQLRKIPFEAVADLHNVLRSNLLAILFRLEGVRIGQINKGRKEKKLLTRRKNKVFLPLLSTTDRYAQVFSGLGLPIQGEPNSFLPVEPLSKKAISLIGKTRLTKIGIAPFAAHSSKMYDLKLMEKVMRKLLDTSDCMLLLFGGGKKEIDQLKQLEGHLGAKVVRVAGRVTLGEELEIISNLDVMIAMDSGNGHLAANYGIPVVTIWGVTHPYTGFLPYKQPMENSLLPDRDNYPLIPTSVYGNKYPQDYENAINTISPDTIVERVKKILQRNTKLKP